MTNLTKTDWRAIARRIRSGKCTPIIGDRLYMGILPNHEGLPSAWAEEIDYPLGDDHSLTHLAQYLSVSVGDNAAKGDFLTFIKAYAIAQRSGQRPDQIIDKYGSRLMDVPLTKIAGQMGYMKNGSSGKTALDILAKMPIPIYITTSYYDFIETRLQRLQKQSYTDSCLWHSTQQRQSKGNQSNPLPNLRKLVLQYFNASELQDMCFHLDIDFETLEGSGKSNKARELITHMQRRNRLSDLVTLGKKHRPQLDWPDVSSMMYGADKQTAVSSSIFKKNLNYNPTVAEPLVYHLFGQETDPNSIVLTEDNYLDFLMRISQEKRLIPPVVAQSLEDSSLLLLGYRMGEWDFRTLFRGLITSRRGSRRAISIAIQLEPDQYTREAQDYLEHYFREVDFKVYWGTSQEFLTNIANYLR